MASRPTFDEIVEHRLSELGVAEGQACGVRFHTTFVPSRAGVGGATVVSVRDAARG